jgi:hypothetical protein
MRALRVLALAVTVGALGVAAVSCADSGSLARSTAPTPVAPEGFDTAAVTIRRADGSLCELCTYVARNEAERSRGLMFATDLGGYDGMLLAFGLASPQSFWMRNTVLPLSAAWFAADGLLVSALDMDPCPAGEQSCPLYGPQEPVLHVLEVLRGDLERFGITAGARLETVGAPCRPNPDGIGLQTTGTAA